MVATPQRMPPAPRRDIFSAAPREKTIAAVPRRNMLAGACLAAGLACLGRPASARAPSEGSARAPSEGSARGLSEDAREWGLFHERFVTIEGRVIDTGNGGVSHTEGQGVAMLAAERIGDRAAFTQIWQWTRLTLRRADALHSWRYRPNAPVPVDDPNNATDGDLLIALALFRAAVRWDDQDLHNAAMATARSIAAALTAETGAGTVLLPGARGFEHADHVVVNPSYYIFPALQRLSTELPHPAWDRLSQSGLALLRQARFGSWRLPADWTAVPKGAGAPEPAGQWPARFSFDAVRVPLYMAWGGMAADPVLDGILNFWRAYPEGAAPAWIDLERGNTAPYAQSSGMIAIRRAVEAARARRAPLLPSVRLAGDYYAAALTLLARIASQPDDPVS